jgi:uncharacterized protein YdeI (YjbR/CyaY-like superfamily)
VKSQNIYRATDRESWRAWLTANHAAVKEVWVLFPKKNTGQPCMSYEDSVEEALCFGWVDSIIKRVDDETYARKFTPRTDKVNWSEVNKRRVAKCIREGRMTEIGMAKIQYSESSKQSRPAIPKVVPVPSFMIKAMEAKPTALANFNALPPSEQRRYALWVTMAKRQETRERRLRESIEMLAANRRLGLK